MNTYEHLHMQEIQQCAAELRTRLASPGQRNWLEWGQMGLELADMEDDINDYERWLEQQSLRMLSGAGPCPPFDLEAHREERRFMRRAQQQGDDYEGAM